MTCYDYLPSPIGDLLLVADAVGLRHVVFASGGRHPVTIAPDWVHDGKRLHDAKRQLQNYFDGRLTDFDLPLAPFGTAFQQRVWSALRNIPYGTTTSYGALAKSLGDKNAMRAVGTANGRNPLPIIIPCHRVIGADGSLTGFGGGLPVKRYLLEHEQKFGAFALTP